MRPASHTGRRLGPAAAIAGLASLGALLCAGCASGSAAAGPAGRPAVGAASTSTAAAGSPATRPAAAPRPSPSVTVISIPQPSARLHQTRAFPSSRTPIFHAEMTDLWAAVVTGKPAIGMPAFFPLGAYRQVKAITDPSADWHDRLVFDFRLDVGAAHALLGRMARRARLVRVIVPAGQASWIVPGACYNGVGYWHVAGARLEYRAGGRLRSIGIASLISWRGRWYVVHFGAVLRGAAVGVVDQPALGPGVPGPPGGC